MSRKSKFLIFFICFIFLGFSMYYYTFHYERNIAEQNLEQYLKAQNVNIENIHSKKIYKNYKQPGYKFDIVYKDDPGYTYNYWYSSWLDDYEFNIRCMIFNDRNISVELTQETIKYRPLD